jgi:hypothetical protein
LKALADKAQHLPNLQTIHLGWNKITDAGLKALADKAQHLFNLQTINLKNNKITSAFKSKIVSEMNLKFDINI